MNDPALDYNDGSISPSTGGVNNNDGSIFVRCIYCAAAGGCGTMNGKEG